MLSAEVDAMEHTVPGRGRLGRIRLPKLGDAPVGRMKGLNRHAMGSDTGRKDTKIQLR